MQFKKNLEFQNIMFKYSTQKSNWLFKDANELAEKRKATNTNYIKKQTSDVCNLGSFSM